MPGVARKSLEPLIPDSVDYFPWQVEGIRTLARRSSFLLADDMGLGKSIQALTVFAIDVMMGRAQRAIIVCPVTLKDNWAEEIEKFTRMQYMILEGTPVRRENILEEYHSYLGVPSILIVNYEQVAAHLDYLNEIAFDVAIFDEAHFIRNHSAKRTKACHKLFARRNYLLTATPMLNQVNELWSLLHKIDPNLAGSYWSFVNRYCVFGGYKEKQIIGVKNKAELQDKLNRVMLRRLAKDHLSLDEPQIIPRLVSLLPEQKKLYDEIWEDMKLTLPSSPTPMDIENALVKYLRLKQICGTTAAVLGPDYDYSAKLDLAIEDDQALINDGQKLVTFTQFLSVQDAYNKRVQESIRYKSKPVPLYTLNGSVPKPDRIPLTKAWAAEDGPAIISCMLQVAGVGLNLIAAHHGSFLDKLFVPKLNGQAVGRLNRIGQVHPVQIRDYRTRGTVETRVEQILKTKTNLFDGVVDLSDYKKLLYKALTIEEEVA